ncbi:DUF6493 family protein [Kitasatospora kazusensis]|uniref:DUF6493 family protein n=1 Tax=Kitasatospora kazusensis TaxID=407974 RepID=A0ABP5LMN9_9ACTN
MNLVELVRAEDVDAVVRELARLTPDQRRAFLPGLKAIRKEIRDSRSWPPPDIRPVSIAGLGCHTSPSGAAGWIGGPGFGWSEVWRHPALLAVIESQPPEWQHEVVARLADRRTGAWWGEYRLLEHLVRTTGCPVPTTDAFVTQWLRDRSAGRRDRIAHLTGGVEGDYLWQRLSGDSFVPLLVPRLFEIADIGTELDRAWLDRPTGGGWPACLARLAGQGVLDRTELIDRCLARLVRGGRVSDQRFFLKVLQALAPTPQEYTARVRSCLALLGGLSTVAAHAQQVLGELDDAGLLAPGLLAEASATVLFRTEKKLVRAQLARLDKAAGRDPAQAGPLVLAAADAFGHPDQEVQERALKVTARHLASAGEAVLRQLREAAGALDPAHAGRAGELFGAEVRTEVYEELLPTVPQPRPVPGPLGSPAETAEELGAVLAGGDVPVAAFERVLDGLVRHAYRSRKDLTDALLPVLAAHPYERPGWEDCGPRDLLQVARAATSGHLKTGVLRRGVHTSPFGHLLAGRLEEAAGQIIARRTPFLLATPTSQTGALSAAVLVERLAGYEALDAPAGPADLAQALLRVRPTEDPEVLAAAGRLGSEAGRRTARWLRDGGLPRQPSTRVRFVPVEEPGLQPYEVHILREVAQTMVAQPGVVLDEPLAADAMHLLGPQTHSAARLFEYSRHLPTLHWLAALPGHREELAARALDCFAATERPGPGLLLPYLAEADGPAGLAVHLAVGYGLGARSPADRAAATDALLVLAARGDLDGGLLGRELGVLVPLGTVKPNRLLEALRALAAAGAYGTVWSVLAGALPGLLAGTPVRGAGDLLVLAADCARRSGARGAVAEVTEAAGRGGASRVVKAAKALRDVLADGR